MQSVSIESLAALLQHCEEFSKRMLFEFGEFHPFGAFLNTEKRIETTAVHLGVEVPGGQQAYEFLQDTLSELVLRKKALAFAIAANVDIPHALSAPFPDGIRVHVAAPSYSRMLYTPYRSLSYRAVRKFLVVLPVVEYSEPIAVEVPGLSCFGA